MGSTIHFPPGKFQDTDTGSSVPIFSMGWAFLRMKLAYAWAGKYTAWQNLFWYACLFTKLFNAFKDIIMQSRFSRLAHCTVSVDHPSQMLKFQVPSGEIPVTRFDTPSEGSMCTLTRFDTLWHAAHFWKYFDLFSLSICVVRVKACQSVSKEYQTGCQRVSNSVNASYVYMDCHWKGYLSPAIIVNLGGQDCPFQFRN